MFSIKTGGVEESKDLQQKIRSRSDQQFSNYETTQHTVSEKPED
jgi:hypothetical protein